jgi:hypothetical protein
MSTPTRLSSGAFRHHQRHAPDRIADELVLALDELDRRDLLEPALVLSAGYLALPFIIQQVLLLLAPIGALLGVSLEGRGGERDLPS